MIKFFTSLNELHLFTLSLEFHQAKTQCQQCLKHNQFVSHGFIYKKQLQGERRVVGKRIFCSNRYGRAGCGRTHQLYLADQIPFLQTNTQALFHFLIHLISLTSIQKAYQRATGTDNPRQAYRWLGKLMAKLVDFRTLILDRWQKPLPFNYRTRRFQLLLPSLQHLFTKLGHQPCRQYQILKQEGFL